ITSLRYYVGVSRSTPLSLPSEASHSLLALKRPLFEPRLTTFEMNTYRCVSKQMTLNPLYSALTQKRGEGVPLPFQLFFTLFSPFAIKRERIHPVHSPRSHHAAQSLFPTQPLQSHRPARIGLDHSIALVFRSRHRPPRAGIRLRQHLASRRPPGSSRGQR